jgi:hypothetical protein
VKSESLNNLWFFNKMTVQLKNRLAILIVVAVVILIIARLIGLSAGKTKLVSRDGGSSPPSHARAHKNNPAGEFLDLFKTPIELYGRVEDQHGKPVPGATVNLYPVDNPLGNPSANAVVMNSDAEGKFSVKGLKGVMLNVSVSKKGYLYISPIGGPSSQASIGYSDEVQSGKRYSNPKTPLVLRLQDPGPLEPLVFVREKRWALAIDGTPLLIALDSEEGKGSHQIEFRLWSDTHSRREPGKNGYSAFDWTFEARIPGGGFIWSDSDLNFEAPITGYKEMIRYHLPASLPRDKWKRFRNGRYFVKFSDGTHARIKFDVDAGSDRRPLTMQSNFNPKIGSRDLATDMTDGGGFHGGDPEKEQ